MSRIKFEDVRVGQVYPTKSGTDVTVLKIGDSENITVQFNDEHQHTSVVANYSLQTGNIGNPTRYLQPDGSWQCYLDVKVGDIRVNNAGDQYTIVEHLGGIKYRIRFMDENGYIAEVTHQSILTGSIRNPKRYLTKDGQEISSLDVIPGAIFLGSQNAEFTVIEKSPRKGYWRIRFNDEYGYEMESTTASIIQGTPKNPYQPAVFGIGYVGSGKYKPTYYDENGKSRPTQEYRAWAHMLERSYYPLYHSRFPTYEGCEVSVEWHNFQNFAEWYTNQHGYKEGWFLDKDLLGDGNLYSKETCTLLPSEINGALNVGGTIGSNRELPAGISINKQGRYQVAIRFNTAERHVKSFATLEQAKFYRTEWSVMYITDLIRRWSDQLDAWVLKALEDRLYDLYVLI